LCNLLRLHRFWQIRSQFDCDRAIPTCEVYRPMPANDPAGLTPDERAHEIASLLAAGVRRLCSPRPGDVPAPPIAPEKSPESAETGLEVGREMRLSVHTG
jgi:hypothetical protein